MLWFFALALAGLLLWTWREALLLAFAAIVIALALTGFAEFLSRRAPLGPRVALIIASVVVLSVLVGLGWLFGAQVSAQITQLADTLPQAWRSLQESLAQNPLGARIQDQAAQAFSANSAGSLMSGLVSRAGGWAGAFASAAVNVVLVISASIFFAIDPGAYRRGLLRLTPKSAQKDLEDALDACRTAIRKWVLGTLSSMVIIAVLVTTGLWVIGVPAPLALGLIAALFQIVPIIGPIVAAAPGILLALVSGPEIAGYTALVYLVASQLEANVIFPLVQKRAVAIPPAVSLFAVVAMGLLFGAMGILLALPLALVLMVFVTKFYVQRVLHNPARMPGEAHTHQQDQEKPNRQPTL